MSPICRCASRSIDVSPRSRTSMRLTGLPLNWLTASASSRKRSSISCRWWRSSPCVGEQMSRKSRPDPKGSCFHSATIFSSTRMGWSRSSGSRGRQFACPTIRRPPKASSWSSSRIGRGHGTVWKEPQLCCGGWRRVRNKQRLPSLCSSYPFVPAKAETHLRGRLFWIPACAGMNGLLSCLMRHAQDRLDGLACNRFRRCALDVGNGRKRDNLLDRKTARDNVIHQHRDEFFGHAVALNYAADSATVLEDGHFKRHFRALARAAEQHAHPTGHQAIDSLAEYLRKCRGLQREPRPIAGHCPDLRHYIIPFFVFDGVRCAQFASQRQPVFVHIDRNNGVAAGNSGRHQSRQSDSANAENDEAFTASRFHYVEDGAGSGLSAAGEGTDLFNRRIATHFHCKALVRDREIAERRLLKKSAVNRRAVFGMQRIDS